MVLFVCLFVLGVVLATLAVSWGRAGRQEGTFIFRDTKLTELYDQASDTS